eukprot:CAMPEP_0206142160 /NCGR_PEP_ID=MMETSP1473-20131121/15839_1 /ASSEMBLY_ACC=CAM_ASM_001109 /TAXON_ID=1461547 /ORGANISM="Stichococcus sp, Strain RCC1054" /LENGTH=219 /DNA_ID=CAMNT_0053537045 /DNA_START=336 /DNA_END=996 /DNA_ORIENTATION=-
MEACIFDQAQATTGSSPQDDDTSYQTLAERYSVTVEVKRSKFVTTAWPIDSADQALQLIQSSADPTASHNCWAFKVGDQYRSSDDGEPGGTAGAPILGAITGEALDGVAVLVTRHFGGTKLGAGGLIRAYGGAAREALRGAPHVEVSPQHELLLEFPMCDIGGVYGMLDKEGAQRVGEESYSNDGQSVQLTVRIPAAQTTALRQTLADVSSGRVAVTKQ